jgi:hypothetical protein
MLKHTLVAIAITVGLSVSAIAAEMSVPSGALVSSASADTATAARDDAGFAGTHASSSRETETVHARIQPDSAGETHADTSSRANVGADGDASAKRHHSRWQSLLPGVMK